MELFAWAGLCVSLSVYVYLRKLEIKQERNRKHKIYLQNQRIDEQIRVAKARTERLARENELMFEEILNGNSKNVDLLVEKYASYLNAPQDYYPNW